MKRPLVLFALRGFAVLMIAFVGANGAPPSLPTAVSQPQADANQTIAFTDVNVIPMDRERVLPRQTVIVRGGQITEIGPAKSVRTPKGAVKIDGRGQYLMPGLADLHIHLHSADHLLSYLAYGVTTVLNLDGDPDDLRLREEIARGARLGPNYYTCGPRTDGNPPVFGGGAVVASPEEARRAIAEQARAGYDFVKVYNNLAPETYAALVAEAQAQGLAVVGHVPRKVGVEGVLQAGQAMIAHGEEYFFTYFRGPADRFNQPGMRSKPDETKIPGIARATAAAGAAVTPNLSFIANTKRQLEDIQGVWADPEAKYLSPAVLNGWKSNNPTKRRDLEQFMEREKIKYPFVKKLTKGLSDAGVFLLLGTDASVAGCFPGHSAHVELRELVAAGLTPYQALATGTRNAGQFLATHARSKEKFGTVAAGQRADLILLKGNPLESIENISQIVGVMARGQWLPRTKLQQMRDDAAAR
ncbi:MAG TPA: amidohydrolase family protein [Blastocatellia bacterium]|nr:amidohydrolase family protein [Blastocatellia bacterium]